MKKFILLLLVMITMSSCLWVPMKMKPYQRNLWNHQNSPRQYYYKKYPTYQKHTKRGKTYTPYFRNGRW